MKKVLSVLLCVFLLLCLVGCSSGETVTEDISTEVADSSSETNTPEQSDESSLYIVDAEILLEDFNQAKGDHFFDFSDSSDTYYENLYLTYNDGSMETYSFMFDDIYGTDPNEMGVVYRGTLALVRDAGFVGGGCFYLLDTLTNTCEFVCYGTDVEVKDDLVYITMGSMDESPDEVTVFNMKTGKIEKDVANDEVSADYKWMSSLSGYWDSPFDENDDSTYDRMYLGSPYMSNGSVQLEYESGWVHLSDGVFDSGEILLSGTATLRYDENNERYLDIKGEGQFADGTQYMQLYIRDIDDSRIEVYNPETGFRGEYVRVDIDVFNGDIRK